LLVALSHTTANPKPVSAWAKAEKAMTRPTTSCASYAWPMNQELLPRTCSFWGTSMPRKESEIPSASVVVVVVILVVDVNEAAPVDAFAFAFASLSMPAKSSVGNKTRVLR